MIKTKGIEPVLRALEENSKKMKEVTEERKHLEEVVTSLRQERCSARVAAIEQSAAVKKLDEELTGLEKTAETILSELAGVGARIGGCEFLLSQFTSSDIRHLAGTTEIEKIKGDREEHLKELELCHAVRSENEKLKLASEEAIKLKGELGDLRVALDSSKEELARAQASLEAAEQSKAERETTVQRLEKELDELAGTCRERLKLPEAKDVRGAIDMMEGVLTESAERQKKLEQEVGKTKAEAEAVKQKACAEVEEVRGENEKLRDAMARLGADVVAQLGGIKQAQSAARTGVAMQLVEVAREFRVHGDRLRDFAGERDRWTGALEREVAEGRRQLLILKELLHRQETEIEELHAVRADRDGMAREIDRLTGENAALRSCNVGNDGKCRALEEELARQSEEMRASAAKVEESQKENRWLREELDKLAKEQAGKRIIQSVEAFEESTGPVRKKVKSEPVSPPLSKLFLRAASSNKQLVSRKKQQAESAATQRVFDFVD